MGAGLPLFLFAAVAVYEAFLLALIFAPAGDGWWGEFAREFRTWCFNYDARTGGMEWASVGMMLLEPIFVAGVAAVLWQRALRAAAWSAHWRAATGGVVTAVLASASLFSLGRGGVVEALPPFPGERIRTHLTVAPFRLTDQLGREFAIEELRGRVVLVTGIYAACSTTCPEILVEMRKLLDTLPPEARARLSVVALSLNPEYENTAIMAGVASGYGFQHPEFRYLIGEPKLMHGVLDGLQFSRTKNPRTGTIDHANLLMLLDARGDIAFRFNLNPRHVAWLRAAVLALTAEAAAGEVGGAPAAP